MQLHALGDRNTKKPQTILHRRRKSLGKSKFIRFMRAADDAFFRVKRIPLASKRREILRYVMGRKFALRPPHDFRKTNNESLKKIRFRRSTGSTTIYRSAVFR